MGRFLLETDGAAVAYHVLSAHFLTRVKAFAVLPHRQYGVLWSAGVLH